MMVVFTWALGHPAEVRRLALAESLLPGFGKHPYGPAAAVARDHCEGLIGSRPGE